MSLAPTNAFPGFIITATTIAVDYWPRSDEHNITHFFLTHCHTDHTKNLDSTWNKAKIFCSKETKKLLVDLNKVDESLINELETNTTHSMQLDLNESFNVTPIDANHCPGAVMFLFEGYFGVVLATGDFRYKSGLFDDTPLEKWSKEIETCYLDNTYLHPLFAEMPTRENAFKQIVRIIETKRHHNNKVLFRIIMRKLGKEDLLVNLSNCFQTKIVIMSELRYNRYVKVLELDSKHFSRNFVSNSLIFVDDGPSETSSSEYRDELDEFIAHRQVITLEPSGLTLCQLSSTSRERTLRSRGCATNNEFQNETIRVPYSDHSSYSELVEFVRRLRPKQVVPIVRRPLPNGVAVSDVSVLNKYLSTTPRLQVIEHYNMLLRSSTSARRTAHLYAFGRGRSGGAGKGAADITSDSSSAGAGGGGAERSLTPIVANQRYITMRRSIRSNDAKKQIEYESQSPQKTSLLDQDECSPPPKTFKSLNDRFQDQNGDASAKSEPKEIAKTQSSRIISHDLELIELPKPSPSINRTRIQSSLFQYRFISVAPPPSSPSLTGPKSSITIRSRQATLSTAASSSSSSSTTPGFCRSGMLAAISEESLTSPKSSPSSSKQQQPPPSPPRRSRYKSKSPTKQPERQSPRRSLPQTAAPAVNSAATAATVASIVTATVSTDSDGVIKTRFTREQRRRSMVNIYKTMQNKNPKVKKPTLYTCLIEDSFELSNSNDDKNENLIFSWCSNEEKGLEWKKSSKQP